MKAKYLSSSSIVFDSSVTILTPLVIVFVIPLFVIPLFVIPLFGLKAQ